MQRREGVLDIQTESIFVNIWHGELTRGMKLWYTDGFPFTSYTTLTAHMQRFRSKFSSYVMPHAQYTTCIERTTMLRAT